jgi:protease-4
MITATLVVAFFSATASSQEVPRTPSSGFQSPYGSVASQDDALSLELNPAGLGFMDTVELGFGYEAPSEDYREVDDRTQAFLAAWGNRTLGLGLAFQELEQPGGGIALDKYRKITLGLGLSPWESLSMGFATNYFGSRLDAQMDAQMAWDVGLQWRVSPNVAFGWTARDINRPFIDAQEGLRARTTFGVHVRFFDGRLQLDNEFTSIQGIAPNVWTSRLLIEPLSGFRLFANAELNYQLTEDDAKGNIEQFWGGFEISLGHLGLAYAPIFRRTASGTHYSSLSAYHWISPNKQRALFDEPNSWVTLSFNQDFREASTESLFSSEPPLFLDLILALDRIAKDDSVDGVLLAGGNSSLGYAQAWELRQAIASVRAANKKVIVYLAQARLRDYYIASAADEIWLYPTESFDPDDLQMRLVNYRGALQKVGVDAEFIRIGAHKSAPEAFVYDEPTEPAKAQSQALLTAIDTEVRTSILNGRSMAPNVWDNQLENRPIFPTEAKLAGLVNRVLYPDEIEAAMRTQFGEIELKQGYNIRKDRDDKWARPRQIAVLSIEGNIVDGRSSSSLLSQQTIGGETFQMACERLAQDRSVEAVVVRIDSSGGSAVASDQMFRALQVLRTKKIVVASMGNIAASGGYYAAAGAQTIFATPMTITGSIGIFTGKFNATELLKWFGVTSTPLSTGERSTNLWEPWTEDEKRRVSAGILYRYRTFLSQIALSRNQSEQAIDQVARGRVWIGSDAMKHQLVDQSGGILDAIRYTEKLAGFEPGELAITPYVYSGSGLNLGFGARLADAFGLVPEADVHELGLLATFQNMLKSPEASALLPLYYPSETALMLPEDFIVVE